ncbi:hypothetical protein VF14_28395 [Nostoc linckia z18]|uniref:DUF3592 domain-containing protein n=2 Tax=Nostoc linckia TaxID=92942 RepID=A0A9Q5ZBB4_NOSLI|nr:DUF3592 domain-containing protein [Nostoc linckia]PHK38527.1 hypothetical protein VF12_17715 [Nostoc linckia z15]PHK43350.1 hypothetical protein VF13_27550 [Nostoc linckia z16]PHJ57965.1 hypothetical protein VF05_34770 [Nostoc linckia z3]PHJ58396.1 hypothetical protein VF02_27805 [Nostoc linckia z1]PHJ65894.1 hypothetical protein VF03_27185 [Nostoc linckia z2]
MNGDTKFFLIFGSIFGGVGTIITVTGIIIGLNTRSFVASAIPTQGTVIELVQRWSTDNKGRSSYVYYPVVQYTTRSGESTVFESTSGTNPPQFAKGQQIEILYVPDKPGSATINSWFSLWFLPLMFTGLGSIFAVVGGVVLLKSFPGLMRRNSQFK